jgi:hypothetical protein
LEEPLFNIEKVIDWEKRIGHYPEKAKKYYHRLMEVQKVVRKTIFDDEIGWARSVDDKKEKIIID